MLNSVPWSVRWVISIVSALGALAASAQTPRLESFVDTVDVRVVNVEVVVTDRSGASVSGLGPEDFRVTVDGVEHSVDYFSEIQDGQTLPVEPLAEGPQPVSDEPVVPINFLVFVDDYFAIGAQRDAALREIGNQLGELGAQDRMAIVAFDGRRLATLSSWSSDPSALRDALASAAERKAFGAFRRAEDRTLGDSTTRAALAARRTDQLQTVVAAAAAAVRGFEQPEGRRVMLVLAGGWSYSPTAELEVDEDFLQAGEQLYRPLIEAAQQTGTTLYPVDVAGLGWTGPDVTRIEAGASGSSFGSENAEESTLLVMARATGGRAMLNTLRSKALERVAADARSYYWIGFTARDEGTDVRRRLKVEVLRQGLKARAREGFVEESSRTRVANAVQGALLFGRSPDQTTLPVRIESIERLPRRQMKVELLIGIPLPEITLFPRGGSVSAEVELRIGVLDARNNLSPISAVPVSLSSDKELRPDGVVRYETELTLRRERHELVVALHDLASGNMISAHLTVEP